MKMIVPVAVMSLLLLYVWERVDLVQLGYQIQQLKAQQTALQRVNDELKVKVSMLTSPERIAHVATKRLAMTQPQPGQVVLVSLEPDAPVVQSPIARLVQLAKNDLDW